jgi:hypothetical protein
LAFTSSGGLTGKFIIKYGVGCGCSVNR